MLIYRHIGIAIALFGSVTFSNEVPAGNSATGTVRVSGMVISRPDAEKLQPVTITPRQSTDGIPSFAHSSAPRLNYSIIQRAAEQRSIQLNVDSADNSLQRPRFENEYTTMETNPKYKGAVDIYLVYD